VFWLRRPELPRHDRIRRREPVERSPELRHLPLQPVEHGRRVRLRCLLTGIRAPTVIGTAGDAQGQPKNDANASIEAGPRAAEPNHKSRRESIRAMNEELAAIKVEAPRETFETIIIDPPWPMTKIERDCRPNQVEFDYLTMSEDELRGFAETVKSMAADDCRKFETSRRRPPPAHTKTPPLVPI
jgi:hypothetical protein